MFKAKLMKERDQYIDMGNQEEVSACSAEIRKTFFFWNLVKLEKYNYLNVKISSNNCILKVERLDQKLAEHEERAEELDRKRTSTISTISLINDRNRKNNIIRAEKSINQEVA